MNLTLHLCRKDLRRLWIPIALFSAVIASKLILGAALLWRVVDLDNLHFEQIGLYVTLESAMEIFIGYALAAAIVHEDVLVGTTAFWITKPISGARLLGSKVLTLLLVFAVLPCAITLPWWVACGFSLKDIGLAALDVIAPLLCTVLLSAAIATLTANFSRFIVWTIGFFAAFTVIMATRSWRAWTVWGEVAHRSPGARDTAYALAALTVVLGLSAVIFHQYRTRRFWQSCALLGGALLIAFSFSPWWRWDLLSRFHRAPVTTADAPELTVEISKFSLLNFPAVKSGELRTELLVRGIPEGHVIVPVQVDATLRWRDLTLDRPRQFSFATSTDGAELPTLLKLSLPVQNPDLETFIARKKAGKFRIRSKRLPPPGPHSMRIAYGANLPPSLAARVEKDPPGYAADVSLQLAKLEVLAETPLTAGEVLSQGSYSGRILRREMLATGELEFGVIERQGPSRNENSAARSNPLTASNSRVDTSFVLVNRPRGNFVNLKSNAALSLRVSGVLITWRLLKVGPPSHWNDTTHEFVPEADWFDQVSIVSVLQRPMAKIRRRLEVASTHAAVEHAEVEPAPSVEGRIDPR